MINPGIPKSWQEILELIPRAVCVVSKLSLFCRTGNDKYRYHWDMCFPGMRISRTHIPRDACFPTHISLKQQLATSHSDMCVPGKCVSPKILLNFTSSPQFEP